MTVQGRTEDGDARALVLASQSVNRHLALPSLSIIPGQEQSQVACEQVIV